VCRFDMRIVVSMVTVEGSFHSYPLNCCNRCAIPLSPMFQIGPKFLILLWFQAKSKVGILLAQGHDGRVEIFRINPGGFSIWMLT
jgi:hypothetical protein